MMQVVGPEEVGVAARAALVDAGRQVARSRRSRPRPSSPAAAPPVPGFAPWPIVSSIGVGRRQVVGVEAVAAGQHLVDQLVGRLALDVEHAAVAGGGRDADPGRRRAQRGLGVARERAVAHAGDRDRGVSTIGFAAKRVAEHGRVSARLAVALQRDAGQACTGTNVRSSKWGRPLGDAEAADAVAAQLGLDLDVLDRLGRPDPQVCEHSGRASRGGSTRSQRGPPERRTRASEKFHSLRPATSFFQVVAAGVDVVRRAATLQQRAVRAGQLFHDASLPSACDLAADVDRAFVHRVADAVAGVAADDDIALSAS